MLNIDKINKIFKKLKTPPDIMDPTTFPLKRNKYFVLVSERSVGKTTQILLWGMCAHEVNGTQIQYIRQSDQMLTPKMSRQLFDTILKYDYVSKVTGGRWNSVEYYAARWTYTKTDDSGKVIEKDIKPFMSCLAINLNEQYKSVYNAPDGNVIIFDEFVSRFTRQDEFIDYCDLLKTIIRERKEPLVFMLGNTLDRYNTYFSEMELLPITTSMPIGEHTETTTSKGTPIYVEFVTREKTKEKLDLNRIFFGFRNKKLGAITGEDWVIVPMPHILHDDTRVTIYNHIYLQYEDYLIQLELCTDSTHGSHICAHMATKTYPDSRIYTLANTLDYRYRYRFGYDKLDKLVWALYDRKKYLYANNTIGVLVTKYVDSAKAARRLY